MPFIWSKQFRATPLSPQIIEVSIPEVEIPVIIEEPVVEVCLPEPVVDAPAE